jgi:hypothetical protein
MKQRGGQDRPRTGEFFLCEKSCDNSVDFFQFRFQVPTHEPALPSDGRVHGERSRLYCLHSRSSCDSAEFRYFSMLRIITIESRDRKFQQLLVDITLTEQTN